MELLTNEEIPYESSFKEDTRTHEEVQTLTTNL